MDDKDMSMQAGVSADGTAAGDTTAAAESAPDARYARFTGVFRCAAAVSIVFAAAASVFITLGFLKQYDNGVDHFMRGSYFLALTAACSVLSLAAAAAGGVMLRKKCSPALPLAGTTPAVFGSSLCAFMLAASAVLDVVSYIGVPVAGLSVAATAAAVLSAAYFFMAAAPLDRSNPLFGLAGLAPVVWSILSLMAVYFSDSLAMNSPHKVCLQLMYVSLMVYFVTECRFALGRITVMRWLFTGCAAILATSLVWVPRVVWAVRGETLYGYTLISTAVFAAATVYIAVRVFTSSKMCAFRPEPKPEKNKKSADGAKAS
jgi:hypothetical protein